MQRRTKIVLVLVLILLFLLMWWWLRPVATPLVPLETGESVTTPIEEPTAPLYAPMVVAPKASSSGIEALARTFAERYASFSAEAKYENVRDVFPLMTTSFQKQEEARIAKAPTSTDYYGVSSQVIRVTIVNETSDEVTADVSLQRVVSDGRPGAMEKKIEVLRLEYVRAHDTWLVANITWNP